MIAFIIRRLLQTVVVLFMVTLIVFSILQVLPGDPVRTLLGPEASPEQVEQTREELGLNRPLPVNISLGLNMPYKGTWASRLPLKKTSRELLANTYQKPYISVFFRWHWPSLSGYRPELLRPFEGEGKSIPSFPSSQTLEWQYLLSGSLFYVFISSALNWGGFRCKDIPPHLTISG